MPKCGHAHSIIIPNSPHCSKQFRLTATNCPGYTIHVVSVVGINSSYMVNMYLLEMIVVEETHTIVFFYGYNYTHFPKIWITYLRPKRHWLPRYPNQISYLPSCIHRPSRSTIGRTSSGCTWQIEESTSISIIMPFSQTPITSAYCLDVGNSKLLGTDTRSPF